MEVIDHHVTASQIPGCDINIGGSLKSNEANGGAELLYGTDKSQFPLAGEQWVGGGSIWSLLVLKEGLFFRAAAKCGAIASPQLKE